MSSAELEEQQEKLRRAVEDWRCRSRDQIANLCGDSRSIDFDCARSRPIELRIEPLEHSGIKSMIDSDNADLAKFMTVLSYDCIEISKLKLHASRTLYKRLLFFGHRSNSKEVPLEGEPQQAVGQSLSLFMDLYETVSRMAAVLKNLLQQLNSLHSRQDKNMRPCISLNNTSLRYIFESLAEGMSSLMVMDEILRQNPQIKGHLSQFRRMLAKVKLDINDFSFSVKDPDCLEEVVSQVEKLLDAGLFSSTWIGQLHLNDAPQKANYSRKLVEAMSSWNSLGFLEIFPRLDTWKERPAQRQRLLQHISIFIFLAMAFDEASEKKVGKVMADMLRKAPIIYVKFGIRINILDLIGKHCPQLLSSWSSLRGSTRDSDSILKNYLLYLTEAHSREWQTIKDSLCYWLVTFQMTLYPTGGSSLSHSDFCHQLKQIIQGMLLASRMHTLALSLIDLHAHLKVPVLKEKFKCLCHMLVIIKVMANTFISKMLQLTQSLPHIINLVQADIEGILQGEKMRLEATKTVQKNKSKILDFLSPGGKDAESKLADSLSLIQLSIRLLQGNGSLKRQKILCVALDVLESIGYADLDFTRIRKLISKLTLIVDFQAIVEEVTDCSFLYWRKELLRDMLNIVYNDDKISWLQNLLDSFCDGLWLLDQGNGGQYSQESFENQMKEDLTHEIIQPLCRDIENDLRLHVHSAYLKGSVSVNLTKTGVRDLSWYLQMRPLYLPFNCIDIRTLVEFYLNSNFYNHAAMALNDRKVYSEMSQVAELKYGILLKDSNDPGLPLNSSGRSFDFIGTLKDLSIFSLRFSYDLIKQCFIEKVTLDQQNKTMVIGVDHVVMAIYAHGSTTIFAVSERIVPFLEQKLRELSDLLEDDILTSLLLKERLWKGGNRALVKYPFVRADQLNTTVAKLSLKEGAVSIIDQLYCIITDIGNGIGLARLLNTGVSRFAHQTSESPFVPANGQMDDRNADFVSPLKRLLSSVSLELQKDNVLHLEDFPYLVPALTVYRMETRSVLKNKSLREPRNQVLPKDGFSVGTCFILKVAGTERQFEELSWFASANKHLVEAMASLDQGTQQDLKGNKVFGLKLWGNQAPPPVSSESQKAKERLRSHQKEMMLIEYGFNISDAIIN